MLYRHANEKHSESFLQVYFTKMMTKAASWAAPDASAPDTRPARQETLPPPPSYQQAMDGGVRRSLLD